MKVLFLSQGRKIEDQIGYYMAWQNAQSGGKRVDVQTLSWGGVAHEYGYDELWRKIESLNREFGPDLIFFQRFQDPHAASPRLCIERLKKASNNPLIFGDVGDLFQPRFFASWTRPIPIAALDVARSADVFFCTAMGGLADFLIREGTRRVVLLPLAFSNFHFPAWAAPVSDNPDFDVVMVGSIGLQKRIPIGSMIHGWHRRQTADALWRRYGKRFGLFGNGWKGHPAWQGLIPFKEQLELYKRSSICVDSRQPYAEMYYASNRPFYIAGSGSRLVQYYTPRLDRMLRAENHSCYVRQHQELISVCDSVLSQARTKLVDAGLCTMQYIQKHHTVDQRVDTIISIAEVLKENKDGVLSESLGKLRFWHFLPEVNLDEEKGFAIKEMR